MEEIEAEGDMFPKRVGERLADARKAAKLDLADIATQTRIPLRHLEAIEEGRYRDLPAFTYCTGFTKAYARALGLDEAAFGRDVRAELDTLGGVSQHEFFEPADPARVPTRSLAWVAAIIGVLLIAAYLFFRPGMAGLEGRDPAAVAANTETLEPVSEEAPAVATSAPAQSASTTGPVVLTALQNVWLRIYDATGQRLFEKEMRAGETYQVPDDANNPQILTGRADSLKVTVGGVEVAPLGPPEKTIADVGVSAAALAARPVSSGGLTAAPSAANVQAPGNTVQP